MAQSFQSWRILRGGTGDGSSDLIAWFPAPAWIFAEWPLNEFELGFFMYGKAAMMQFISVLGLQLQIFSTNMTDSDRAFVSKDCPVMFNATNPQERRNISASTAAGSSPCVSQSRSVVVNFHGAKVTSLTIRCSIVDAMAKQLLADKNTGVTTHATSSSTVRV